MTDLDSRIAAAIEAEDLDDLKRLQSVLLEHCERRQDVGDMATRLVVQPTPQAAAALGVGVVVEEAAGLLELANRVARAIRLVEFRLDRRNRPNLPTVVAEGDSWFLHPLIRDVLQHLRSAHFNVRSLAGAGDTVEDMLSGRAFIDTLREEGSRVFLFSGGGNDLLGGGRIARVVRRHAEGVRPEDLIDDTAFSHLLDRVIADYAAMCRDMARIAPQVQVFAHGYDHVARLDAGPWLWPFLLDLGYPKPVGVAVVRILLDRFNAALADLENDHANFTHVDVRGSVGSGAASWFDAIHPRSPGFGKVADRLTSAVTQFLSIRRRGAVEAAGLRGAAPGGFGDAPMPWSGRPSAPRSRTAAARPLPRPDFGARGRPVQVQTSEAITRGFDPNLTDFESVRAIVRTLPGEDEWLHFEDPLVYRHIHDVIDLLQAVDEPESPEIIANRLHTRPMGMVRDAEYGRLPVVQNFRVPSLQEALFGDTELEPVQILLKGYKAGRAVARVQVMSEHGTHVGHGTGFLVAPGLLLTNQHVLADADVARRSFVIFGDETPLDGSLPRPTRFRISGETFLASDQLDYAFASIEPVNRDGAELAAFGQLALIRESGKAVKFEPVSIIQHPGGDPKAVAIRNSFVMGRIEDGIYYTTDTLGGSSGSPVLNREWQVIALHHRFVPHPTVPDAVLANRGVRISKILEDLNRRQGGSRDATRVVQMLNQPQVEAFDVAGAAPRSEAAAGAPSAESDVVVSGAYAGLTEAEFLAAIARDPEAEDDLDLPLPEALRESGSTGFGTEALAVDPISVLRRIGQEGYRFIVGHEVSSRANYDRRLKNPILPGAASGITIGIGYDLGYHSLAEFRSHWGDLLAEATLRQLEVCLGKTRAAAAAVLPEVRSVSISYEDAAKVFERASLPAVFAQLNRHIEDAVIDRLAPRCVAVLVSLTFNRGPSFRASGDRYREMRAIRAALNGGEPERVPALIRAMKRLWEGQPNVRGLLRRRDEEAALFEAGLEDGPTEAGRVESTDQDYDPRPDLDEESQADRQRSGVEASAVRLQPSDVAWVSQYANNPDYGHLPASAQGATFELNPALVERIIALGHYQPHFTAAGHLVVAIRGALIMSGEEAEIGRDGVMLMEQKPDHRTYRCVIAVYHRDRRKVSAFRASTVPNRGGVASCANRLNGLGGDLANALPTGCYQLCVGTHFGSSVTIPTVLRLGTGPNPDSALRVTTLRTKNDGIYGTQDIWDPCRPADNVHPGFAANSAEFSSLGCLTVPGRFRDGVHSGIWSRFRETAGFDGTEHMGTRYDLLLTTGMEMAAASAAADEGRGLRRLAHGSAGDPVRSLQQNLGGPVSGTFDPDTKRRLTEREQSVSGGSATGIYSLATEAILGFGIF